MRRGSVLVANALGSSLVESGNLFGFLPALAERLLGEPLRMPSLATWWCGEPAAMAQALARLESLIVKPAFPQQHFQPIFGQDLDAAGREALAARIRERPNDYLAQELVCMSQAPVWEAQARAGRLGARAMGLRVFVCASPNGYMAMPGGLARVATGPDTRVLSMQRGGSSKDSWVLSSAPVSTFSLLRKAIGPDDLLRSGLNLSSRVVENLFWFGRHVERCDATARLLRVALGRLTSRAAGERGWPAIAALLVKRGLLSADELTRDDLRVDHALCAAVVDDTRPGLARAVRELSQIALRLRERMSTDNWRLLHVMQRNLVRRRVGGLALSEAIEELDQAIASLMTLAGFALDGMTRDLGWRFMSCGRRIERLRDAVRDAAAGDRRRAWRRDRVGAAARRQRGHLPLALPVEAGMAAGARPADPRRIQPALDQLPARRLERLRAAHRAHHRRIPRRAHRRRGRRPRRPRSGDRPRSREPAPARAARRMAGGSRHLSELIGQRFFSHVAEDRHQSVSA